MGFPLKWYLNNIYILLKWSWNCSLAWVVQMLFVHTHTHTHVDMDMWDSLASNWSRHCHLFFSVGPEAKPLGWTHAEPQWCVTVQQSDTKGCRTFEVLIYCCFSVSYNRGKTTVKSNDPEKRLSYPGEPAQHVWVVIYVNDAFVFSNQPWSDSRSLAAENLHPTGAATTSDALHHRHHQRTLPRAPSSSSSCPC